MLPFRMFACTEPRSARTACPVYPGPRRERIQRGDPGAARSCFVLFAVPVIQPLCFQALTDSLCTMERRNPCFFRRLRTLSIAMGVYTPSAVFMERGSRSSDGGAKLGMEVHSWRRLHHSIVGPARRVRVTHWGSTVPPRVGRRRRAWLSRARAKPGPGKRPL
jgi:hypothetical protein